MLAVGLFSGNVQKAVSLFEAMESAGLQADMMALSTLLFCLNRARCYSQTLLWYDRMRQRGLPLSEVACNEVLVAAWK